MICEMFSYYATKGISLLDKLDELYKAYGYCLNTLHSYEFDVLHLGKTGTTIELIAVQGVEAVSVSLVQLVQLVQQADALGRIVAEHLAGIPRRYQGVWR